VSTRIPSALVGPSAAAGGDGTVKRLPLMNMRIPSSCVSPIFLTIKSLRAQQPGTDKRSDKEGKSQERENSSARLHSSFNCIPHHSTSLGQSAQIQCSSVPCSRRWSTLRYKSHKRKICSCSPAFLIQLHFCIQRHPGPREQQIQFLLPCSSRRWPTRVQIEQRKPVSALPAFLIQMLPHQLTKAQEAPTNSVLLRPYS